MAFRQRRVATAGAVPELTRFSETASRRQERQARQKRDFFVVICHSTRLCAGADLCLGTKIPEAVPTAELRFNHWALVDADGTFDTKRAGRGSGSGVGFTTVDTAGCSCEQIIAVLGLGIGQREYGCSTSVMQAWIAQVQP